MATLGEDIPYVESSISQFGTSTLIRSGWTPVREERSKPSPPSILNIPMAILSCLLCPILGFLAVLYSVEARVKYNQGRFLESEALCTRARGTAIYSMAIGVGLLVIMGLLLGLGARFNWY
ncbi:uncharacterized protein LOC135331046 [Halichondria panicea]|uniref:uncharacterized protein LOC135331046 n=1 Tax=Halichondria panicea TaxID=6063 RepID=UPI00312B325E